MRVVRSCQIAECTNVHSGKGYCRKHYDETYKSLAKLRAQKPANVEKRRKRSRTTERRNYTRNHSLMRQYGITIDVFGSMCEEQAGLCAICTDPMIPGTQTHVDHCHKTGRVRALLCVRCNAMIGYARESSDILYAATTYVGLFCE